MKFLVLAVIFSLLLLVSQSFAQLENNDLAENDFGDDGYDEK
jgi:hypothetical protein